MHANDFLNFIFHSAYMHVYSVCSTLCVCVCVWCALAFSFDFRLGFLYFLCHCLVQFEADCQFIDKQREGRQAGPPLSGVRGLLGVK